MGEVISLKADLVQIVRLTLTEQTENVHLLAARLVRKYRGTEPELAEQVDCMFFLDKLHIGEVQASIWLQEVHEICRQMNIKLL